MEEVERLAWPVLGKGGIINNFYTGENNSFRSSLGIKRYSPRKSEDACSVEET